MQKFSYLKSQNAEYIDELYSKFQKDPGSVDESWRYFFEGLELGGEIAPSEAPHENGYANGNGHAGGAVIALAPRPSTAAAPSAATDLSAEAKVANLIQAYRQYGKLIANIDPLNAPPSSHPLLALSEQGLAESDLGKTFQAGKLIGLGAAKLSDIVARLKDIYCRTIAIEVMHIEDKARRQWLLERIESVAGRPALDAETRKLILKRLTDTETFERFLHTRYVAQKRFSVEGGDAVIPMLDCMIETGAESGAREVAVGMAHRGRLNTLTNVYGKKPEYIFTEFEGNYKVDIDAQGEGDVKYHKGYSADITTRKGKKVHLSLAFNPSHLEFVNPVIEGSARAKQDRLGDKDGTQVVPILIHGDAAFAGQGVCYETLNMALLPGYKTGGTLHIVINNQVGFTAIAEDTRSTQYCTDVAKMLDAPVLHVNGDDAEAAWFVSQLSTEYRQKFHQDFFIDLVCYRRHGHNEGDEPAFTQPLMYKKIKAHPTARELYARSLADSGVVTADQAQAWVDERNAKFTEAQAIAKAGKAQPYISVFESAWKGFKKGSEKDMHRAADTTVDATTLKEIAEKINRMPSGFKLHPKLARFFEARLKAVEDGKGIDWGNGEALAYASLVHEGHSVRLSGQDAERGTFTHRHSVLHDIDTGETYIALNSVAQGGARYQVYNSLLSETGVLGFEYGYSLAAPDSLVIWEAQFGDFANGAQVIIDQFLSSSESKWQRMSGLTLLLPHGYEGQGPEHSSARLERFLSLCGRANMQVANLSTPAQIFHALRRQVVRDFRKPLVVMSPKSLLRHPQAISTLDEFTKQGFQELIDDREIATAADAKKVKRVLLCSGKVYYELAAERTARKRADIAIVRVEQLYPWPAEALAELLESRYKGAKDIVWVQEEPRNMGAWPFVFATWSGGLAEFGASVGGRAIRYVGRDTAAAPAVGSHKQHEMEQKSLVERAFAD